MSLFRLPKLQRFASTVGTIRKRFNRKPGKSVSERVNRRLLIDTLEERQLLTVAPYPNVSSAHIVPEQIEQMLVNETYAENQYTVAGKALATDNDGDFVVAWTRYDEQSPGSGTYEANIYARYFTDEVQRIVLPEGVIDDAVASQYATFSLDYNGNEQDGNEQQKLTVKATNVPSTVAPTTVEGMITLGYDINGDGTKEENTFHYDETDMVGSAQRLADALDQIGGDLGGVEVTAISPGEFLITFHDSASGDAANHDLIEVMSSTSFSSGFYPTAEITAYRDPATMADIPISPDDPNMTAYAIEQYFSQLTETYYDTAPIYFYGSNVHDSGNNDIAGWYYTSPMVLRTPVPEVSVTSVCTADDPEGLRTFDITFVGNSGKINQPEMKVSAVADEWGNPLALGTVTTLKETSSEFRVNAVEEDNPFTPGIDKYNQYDAAVAMDADGDFIITWVSEIPDQPGSRGRATDIYARQFSPTGLSTVAEYKLDQTYLDGTDYESLAVGSDGEYTSVRTNDEFLVNEFTTGAQSEPDVGVDETGNFTIVWTNEGEDTSFYNQVHARRFNRHGESLGSEFIVSNSTETNNNDQPSVAVSNDGHTIITWSESHPTVVGSGGILGGYAEIYSPEGDLLVNQFSLGSVPNQTTADWDSDNNFVIAWHDVAEPDDLNDTDSIDHSDGVRAKYFTLYDDSGQLNLTVFREEFRVNSANLGVTTETTAWPLSQSGPQVGLDADGDLVITYDGYGPDVCNYDIDSYIENDLLTWMNGFRDYNGTPDDPSDDTYSCTAEEIAAKRLELEYYYYSEYLRGEANGVMFSRWDANEEGDPWNVLNSDSIINSDRDGQNQRYYFAIDEDVSDGGFTIRLWRNEVDGYEDIDIELVYYDTEPATLDIGETVESIREALCEATRTGHNWEHAEDEPGPVQVNVLDYRLREATDWDLGLPPITWTGGSGLEYGGYVVFEIIFQGESHNSGFDISLAPGDSCDMVKPDPVDPDGDDIDIFPIIDEIMIASYGTSQYNAAMDMEPDGDFVTAWTQAETYSGYYSANDNIYYREIDERTDTAGPRLVDLYNSDGNGVGQGESIEGGTRYIVLTFDEEMLATDPSADPDSILNPLNFTIYRDGVEIPEGIAHVEFGMNCAANLAGTIEKTSVYLTGQNNNFSVSPTAADAALDGSKLIFADAGTSGDTASASYDAYGKVLTVYINPGETTCQSILDAINAEGTFTAKRLVEDGGNDASGTVDDLGEVATLLTMAYDLSAVPSNKWEAVLILDANGGLVDGVTEVAMGNYTIEAKAPIAGSTPEESSSGLRDAQGNPLAKAGVYANGQDMSWNFRVNMNDPDIPVGSTPEYTNGTTSPETPSAVAADGDGDHVVVWTGHSTALGVDRIYMCLYDPEGVAYTPVTAVTPGWNLTASQDNASVAMDKDGDFIVTWTNTDSSGDKDIYAQRFHSDGTADGDIFRVNTYTDNTQQWSDVAMDTDGDFVVTWSSYGQEDNGQMGYGYGVYARKYDSFGQPLAPEFQVNVTKAGNQQSSSVAISSSGDFVVAWTSDQNGSGDDIVAREFNADGTPMQNDMSDGYLDGEVVINDIIEGNQRNPDVAMSLDGSRYVVTWTDSASDLNGCSVWAEVSEPLPRQYGDKAGHSIWKRHEFTTTVTESTTIEDVNFHIAELVHGDITDLRVSLISPEGTEVVLFEDLPYKLQSTGQFPEGNSIIGLTLDDEAPSAVRIIDSDMGAVPPYTGIFAPQENLDLFDGENAQGTWTLVIWDRNDNGATGYIRPLVPDGMSWWLDISGQDDSAESFLVNTTRDGHQMYSSVTMDHEGNFTIAWCGNGMQENQEDESGHGVFYQRYDKNGSRWFGETRANQTTDGDQWLPSIASDGEGNFILVWTGDTGTAMETDIYKLTGVTVSPVPDDVGPIVTDVWYGTERLLAGDYIDSSENITTLKVAFDEDLMQYNGTEGVHSVLNPNNWILERNGSEIPGIISSIDFELDPVSHKYVATLTLDGNGLNNGTPGLSPGDYTLYIRDAINDVSIYYDPTEDEDELVNGNALDGNYDGVPGSDPIKLAFGGYRHQFSVSDGPVLGAEYLINSTDTTQYEQRLSENEGTGRGQEESTRSVAVDHDGDYVVVWTSYGQDDASDSQGAGVYMRLYDRNNNPLTDEVLVNKTVEGHQRNASVAMDADGDFVIVWESEGQDDDGSWGIYGQQFNSVGDKIGEEEFQVNVEKYTGNQCNPTVAMDNSGNFVVAWATAGQDFSFFNDVYIQRYSNRGERFGLAYLVNDDGSGLPQAPAGDFEVNPAIAMDGATGNFMVAWDHAVAQTNGVVTDTEIQGRLFNFDGTPITDVFRADTAVGIEGEPEEDTRTARNAQLTVDSQGNYIMVWESYSVRGDGDETTTYNILYRHFDSEGTAGESAYVNMSEFVGMQVNPSVAVDADGDFAVVWNGEGAEPHQLNTGDQTTTGDHDLEGIFVRSYDSSSAAVTVESRVNRTEAGVQQFPTIAMEPDGDYIVVWSGRGIGDEHGIFARRYDESTDTAGPLATELRSVDDDSLIDETLSVTTLNQIKVIFDEEMLHHNGWASDGSGDAWEDGDEANSVENPANWILTDGDGVKMRDIIQSVKFTLNPATNKWEAVLTFAEDLTDDNYTLTAVAPVDSPVVGESHSGLCDAVGNALGLTGFTPDGYDISFNFEVLTSAGEIRVNPDVPNDQDFMSSTDVMPNSPQSVASDADGDYVVVWTETAPEGALNEGETLGIFARRYEVVWTEVNGKRESSYAQTTPISVIDMADLRFDASTATYASVARDGDGDFIVTWSAQSLDGDGSYDVWYRRFDAVGNPIGAAQEVSTLSFVDFDEGVTGTFTLNWTNGIGVDVSKAFSYTGDLETLAGEIQAAFSTWGELVTVEEVVTSDSGTKSLAITFDVEGGQSDIMVSGISLGGGASVTTHITAETTTQGSTDGIFRANTETDYDQMYSTVATDIYGNFVIAWQSEGQDGNGFEVYAKRFDREGNVLGVENETQVLSFEGNPRGEFTIYWDGNESAPIDYQGNGDPNDAIDLADAVKAAMQSLGADVRVEWLNSTDLQITFIGTAGQEDLPEIQINSGDLGSPLAEIGVSTATDGASGEFRANETTEYDQQFPMAAMDSLGDFIITWTSNGQDGDDADQSNIYARLWTATTSGVTAGGEFLVNETTDNIQKWSSVAMDADGDFVVTWTSYSEDIGNNEPEDGAEGIQDVMARRFNADGTAVVFEVTEEGSEEDPVVVFHSEFLVNTFTSGTQQHSQVAMDADGNFIIAWESFQDRPGRLSGRPDVPENYGIYAQRYVSNDVLADIPEDLVDDIGTYGELGDERQINSTTDNDQRYPGVAMDDAGDYVIVWSGYGEILDPGGSGDMIEDDDQGIYSRQFPLEEDLAGPTVTDVLNVVDAAADKYEPVADGAELSALTEVVTLSFIDFGGVNTSTFTMTMGSRSHVFNYDAANGGLTQLAADIENEFKKVSWNTPAEVTADEADGTLTIEFENVGDQDDIVISATSFQGSTTGATDIVSEITREGLSVEQFVVIFGENLNTEYGENGAHSILNPDNWILHRDGEIVEDGIAGVAFSLVDGKYQATITFDGDPTKPGNQPLEDGLYTLTVSDTVEDIWGNDLDGDYDGDAGEDFVHSFRIRSGSGGDTPVDPGNDDIANARTYAETPGAVAVDGDGDHIVVWTAYDSSTGLNRVYMQVFNADGTERTAPTEVTPEANFAGDGQRYAAVACDEDGDFVVTWTNSRDTTGDGVNNEQDIYARRYSSDGTALGDAFCVNTYTENNQKYSSVAMDLDGDFVVTWSSMGQEDNGQLGRGYGIYARRYDNYGQPLAPEFAVNITTAGNQMLSSVAMDLDGDFVIAWQSNQNGVGDDIIVRVFDADATPWGGPWGGEILVNDTTDGNQRYPDVAMSETGQFVVTWTGTAGNGDDADGTAVYAQRFDMGLLAEYYDQNIPITNLYESTDVGQTIAYDLGSVVSTIDIANTYTIADINVKLDITHPEPEELVIFLRSPDGTIIELCREVPTSGADGQDFQNTDFDDERDDDLTVPYISIQSAQAVPPFSDRYIPKEPLSSFDLQNVGGTWELIIQDNYGEQIINENEVIEDSTTGTLNSWSLEITRVTPKSGEFQVNTSTTGDQLYSSVSMNRMGAYTITWSGYGDQEGQEDKSGYGVYYQRYYATDNKIGGETRVNSQTTGNQWMSSVDSDGEGNFVIVWTGLGRDADGRVDNTTTGIYKYLSSKNIVTVDGVSPLVTGILDADGDTLMEGGVLVTTTDDTSTIIVLFDEEMSTEQTVVDGDRCPATNSVLNLSNWSLERNGIEIEGAISDIEFKLNDDGKYEARLTLDGNGMDGGTPALEAGTYTLMLSDLVTDVEGNKLTNIERLSTNRENEVGTPPYSNGLGGLVFSFYISEDDDRLGAEFRINDDDDVDNQQKLGTNLGIGQAEQESTMAVAVDNDGDFAVVWTSYGQDDPDDPQGAGVYLRLFSGQGDEPIALGGEILVNEGQTEGNQRNASVAIDADGDIIVVWEAENANGTWDVWARRFDAAGNPVVSDTNLDMRIDSRDDAMPFQVNTFEANDQLNPAVACDDYGNFIIVWASKGQTLSYFNDVHAQMFNYMGEQVGEEFQINETSIPGMSLATGVSMINPTVAMSGDGSQFVVAWEQNIAQSNGVVTDSNVVARLFNSFGDPLIVATGDDGSTTVSGEFQVNSGDFTSDALHSPHVSAGGTESWQRSARNPQVTMSDSGSFVVVWEAYQDNDTEVQAGADSYGIYYRSFDATGNAVGTDQQANLVVTEPDQSDTVDIPRSSYAFEGDQVNPSIAMDGNGNFTIVWDGNGAEPNPTDQIDPDLISDRDDAGVFLRSFNASGDSVSVEQRVNQTTAGVQEFATVGMTASGGMIVVWCGNGIGDQHGIFARSYESQVDTVGPTATELRWLDSTGNYNLVGEGDNIVTWGDELHTLYVVFDEEMNTSFEDGVPGEYSVENINNWAIVNGRNQEIQGAIESVDFVYNTTMRKWTAEVNLSSTAGLENGDYVLYARSDMQDKAGNSLGRNGLRPNGLREDVDGTAALLPITNPTGGFGFAFRMNDTLPGDAPYGDIDQNVSWASVTLTGDDDTEVSDTDLVQYQEDSAVARNSKGDYVVVWVHYSESVASFTSDLTIEPIGDDTDDDTDDTTDDDTTEYVVEADIIAQRFDSEGRAIGGLILVNSLTTGMQIEPDVAIDDDGNFVVVWSGEGSAIGDESGSGIFAKRYDDEGKAVGGQFLVNQYTQYDQDQPSVSMNQNNGDFVIAWTSYKGYPNHADVMARKYHRTGQAYANEFLVNSYTTQTQSSPDVAMNTSGNFVITWESDNQDSSEMGVYAQRYNSAAQRVGGEFRVNTTQHLDQQDPAVAINNAGNFVITWESRNQDGSGWGIYAQRYNSAGAAQGGEFRVNQTTQYFQQDPDVAMNNDGVFLVTWSSFDQDNPQDKFIHDYGIYARMYEADGSDYIDAVNIGPNPVGEFRVNGWTDGDQIQPAVAAGGGSTSGEDCHFVITWTGQYMTLETTYTVTTEGEDDDNDTEEEATAEKDIPAIFSRLIDPPAEMSSQAATLNTVHLTGTSGNDLFEFIGGPLSSSWLVRINGEVVDIDANVGTITFNGGGGNDEVILIGSLADDSVELWANRAGLSSADYIVNVENVEKISVDGGGGYDVAAMHDSTGDDLFTFKPGFATLAGTHIDLRVDGFEHVTAIATSGTDTAKLYGSEENDLFIAHPDYAAMETGDVYGEAQGFDYQKGYAVEGGYDVAQLHDGSGDDFFDSTPTFARLYNTDEDNTDDNFYSSAENFYRVEASSVSGSDVAVMKDSAGDDTFDARPGYGKLYDDDGTYFIYTEGFKRVEAHGDAGGENTAYLYDTAGDDIFVAGPGFGKLTGNGYSSQANKFQKIVGYGTAGGNDTAELYDSDGDDAFIANPNYGEIYGEGFHSYAYSFESINTRSINGGNDTALLYDSAMNDYLSADNEEHTVTLLSAEADIRYWVKDFHAVEARSTNEGDKKSSETSMADFLLATGMWEEE